MQTLFTPEQLADPALAHSETIIRKCVHCGFCTATCPTYVELGNELDSPRGRISLIKNMLEQGRPADEGTVKHIDRCLSCLSCMTTCPSGVNYMHLVDHARLHIEQTYRRPFFDRLIRALLAQTLPYPKRFKSALQLARFGQIFKPLLRKIPAMKPFVAMLDLAPSRLPASRNTLITHTSGTLKQGRVAILSGCAQSVLDPEINAATTRLLTRLGIEIVSPSEEGCCGAIVHHMGRENEALTFAKANIDSWNKLIENGGLDAIIITASGCGTSIKDYGHMLRLDPVYAEKAKMVSALAKDITEYLDLIELPEPVIQPGFEIVYHSACSMQHGQNINRQPRSLLKRAGFTVNEPYEGHLCCGSAGVYNILQSEIATRLRDRKVRHLEATGAALVSTGNIGCITQISQGTRLPVIHTVQLLDWAFGGPRPEKLNDL